LLRKEVSELPGPARILTFDGHCRLCRRAVGILRWLDVFQKIEIVDFTVEQNHHRLKNFDFERAQTEMLLETEKGWKGGFAAFKELSHSVPAFWPLVPFLHLPGIDPLGAMIYRLIARNRYLLLGRCEDGYCEMHKGSTGSGVQKKL